MNARLMAGVALLMQMLSADAFAQTAPTVSAPQAPQPPVVAAPAQPADSAQEKAQAQLQKLLGSGSAQQALQQGLAIAKLMQCTQQAAGVPATQKFKTQMEALGKRVQQACAAGQPQQARAQMLEAMQAHKYDPVVLSAKHCYANDKAGYRAVMGPKLAPYADKYERWSTNPDLAAREMTDADICQPKSPESAAPAPTP